METAEVSAVAAPEAGGPSVALRPLPSQLPTELDVAIRRVLSPPAAATSPQDGRGPVSTSPAAVAATPSLTAQLAALFPSADDLSPVTIAKRQAEIRHELAQQEVYIASLLARLTEKQNALAASEGPGASSAADLKQRIQVLSDQLNIIRDKAHRSEEVVRSITRDIRMLDTCKRNVVTSLTALKRLQMLVNGAAQLERLANANRFREAASSLSAVKALLASFEGYSSIERVAAVSRDVERLQREMGEKARAEFEAYFTSEERRPVRATNLVDAALVIDSLGPEACTSLVDFYTTLQLREYRRIFRATDEAGQLDNVSRRFAWFRRVLKTYDDEHAAVFEQGPIAQWNVARELARRFVDITRQDIRSVLIRSQGKIHVPVLLEALQASLDFEKAMSRRFGVPFDQISGQPASERLASAAAPSTSAAAMAATTLSSAFDPYLGLFVEQQDRTLSEMLQTFKRQGTRASMDETSADSGRNEHHTVLPSSTELFYFYGQVLEQCARLSTREPFRDLCLIYQKHLRAYSEEVLRPLLYRSETGRRSGDTRSSVADLQRVCLIVNTADYCATTAKQLEEKLREKIDKRLQAEVDFTAERDGFLAVVSTGIVILARELEVSTEGAFNQMTKVPWSAADPTENTKSAYVDVFAGALEHVAVVVRQDIQSKRYVRSWCDRVVGHVLARFLYNIVKLRPITTPAAGQMLLDIGEIRIFLLELPRYSLSDEGSTSAASSYKRYVTKGVGRIETLLKVLSVSEEIHETLVDKYMELVCDRSYSNFQKILDLKGVNKAEQNNIIDTFVAKTSNNESLEDTSFLTTLDMDPALPATPAPSTGPPLRLQTPDAAQSSYALPNAAGFLSFMSGGQTSYTPRQPRDGGGDSGANTPTTASVPQRYASLTLGGLGGLGPVSSGQDRSASGSPGGALAGAAGSMPSGDGAVGAGAQRALSDLRRFGSLLVGKRDPSNEGRR